VAEVRRIGPIGVPCVGTPPVTVSSIARAIAGAGLPEEKLAAAKRAHPSLADDEASLAIDLAEREPASLAPAPGLGHVVGLALPLGLGSLATAVACATLVSGALFVFLRVASAGRGETWPEGPVFEMVLEVGFAIVVAAVELVLGVGLARLQRWARWGFLGLVVLATLVAGARLVLGAVAGDTTFFELVLGGSGVVVAEVLALSLFLPPVSRWLTPEGRATRNVLASRTYAAAVTWGALFFLSFALVPAFRKMFAEVGVQLPVTTEIVLSLGSILEVFAPVLAPLLGAAIVLGVAPLLFIPVDRERPAFWAVNGVGIVAFGSVLVALALPLVQLYQRL
jgi:hypothetical protein